MPGILADNDVQGQLEILLRLLAEEPWSEIWASLSFTVQTFETLGLSRDVADSVLWQTCQQHQVVLITGNRNDDGPDSLEATIRNSGAPDSLPVVTLANAARIRRSRAYAERAAEQLLEYLFDIERHRGTGRIYVP